jgi:hypothetical protein
MRLRYIGLVAPFAFCALVAIACSSKKSSDTPPLVLQQLGSGDIGPNGGTVTAGAVTIDIPAGALTETKTIVINQVVSGGAALPSSTQINGNLYALQPDDVEFLKPVTVTVALDATQVNAAAQGALVLFRAPGSTSQWTPYAADQTDATKLVGTTTHFSQWAATGAGNTSCYKNQCPDIPPPGPPDPSKLPGINCNVPMTGPGVHCEGKGQYNGPPYVCNCIGSDIVLGTYSRLPPDNFITATAVQCGAACADDAGTPACDMGLTCDPPGSNGSASCQTTREPRMLCNYGPGGSSCSCVNGKSFTLSTPGQPMNDALAMAWVMNCGGSCDGPNTANDYVCPGSIEYPNEAGSGCIVESAGTCRDNHYYGYDCALMDSATDGGGSTCTCKMDGVPTGKVVMGMCGGGYATWVACGFPKMMGQP